MPCFSICVALLKIKSVSLENISLLGREEVVTCKCNNDLSCGVWSAFIVEKNIVLFGKLHNAVYIVQEKPIMTLICQEQLLQVKDFSVDGFLTTEKLTSI